MKSYFKLKEIIPAGLAIRVFIRYGRTAVNYAAPVPGAPRSAKRQRWCLNQRLKNPY